VARLVLGATLFCDQAPHWAAEGAAQAFALFLRAIGGRQGTSPLQWFTVSTVNAWHRFSPASEADVLSGLRLPFGEPRLRHLMRFAAVDDVDLPSFAFRYREIDDLRFPQRSSLQIWVPPLFSPEVFARLFGELASLGPFVCGVAGPTASWREAVPKTAFGGLHAWTRRYWGLELLDPDAAAGRVAEGLPAISWLTLIGPTLLREKSLDVEALRQHAWRPGAGVSPVGQGVLVRASATPDLGDVNQLRVPSELMEVARMLRPAMLPELPPLPGPFADRDVFEAWRWRLVEPEGWRA